MDAGNPRDGHRAGWPCAWDDFWQRFGRPILDAVVYAQKKQIVHRDIKPKNILVSADGVPKLEFVAKDQKERISIAVLSGYTAQVRLLGEMIQRGTAEGPSLDIACFSVDAFQRRQADVCIYSVVRSNGQKDLGFLREHPRLNVALSRGKSGLVIVGDNFFCRNVRGKNPFKAVIDYIDNNDQTCKAEELQ